MDIEFFVVSFRARQLAAVESIFSRIHAAHTPLMRYMRGFSRSADSFTWIFSAVFGARIEY